MKPKETKAHKTQAKRRKAIWLLEEHQPRTDPQDRKLAETIPALVVQEKNINTVMGRLEILLLLDI